MVFFVQTTTVEKHSKSCGVVPNFVGSTSEPNISVNKNFLEILFGRLVRLNIFLNNLPNRFLRKLVVGELFGPQNRVFAFCIPATVNFFEGRDFLRRFRIGHLIEKFVTDFVFRIQLRVL